MRKKIGNFRQAFNNGIYFVPSSVGGDIRDPVRQYYESYWKIMQGSNEYSYKIPTEIEQINSSLQNSKKIVINPEVVNGAFSSKTANLLRDIVGRSSETFYDFYFEFTEPFNISDASTADLESAGTVNTSTTDSIKNISFATKYKLSATRNYISKTYEDISQQQDIEEKHLLNFYAVLGKDLIRKIDFTSQTVNGQTTVRFGSGSYVEKLVSLFGSITNTQALDPGSSLINKQEYFSNYATNIANLKSSIKDYKNFYITDRDFSKYYSSDYRKDAFSAYVNLQLYKDRSGEILEAAKELGVEDFFVPKIFSTQVNISTPSIDTFAVNFYNYERTNNSLSVTPEKKILGYKYFNFIDFLNNNLILNTNLTPFLNEEDTSNYSSGVFRIGNESENSGLAGEINRKIFALKVDQIVSKYERNYQDILAGKPAYSEILGFTIVKKRSPEINREIQKFFFLNNNSDLVSFIDTQIKKGAEYLYDVYYSILVLGSSYKYSILRNNGGFLELGVEVKPEIRVYQVPITPRSLNKLISGVVPQTPPNYPTIVPVVYKNEKNKIKFNFIKNANKLAARPILIEPQDLQKFKQAVQSQLGPSAAEQEPFGKIFFNSVVNTNADPHIKQNNEDDLSETYEIFKTTVPPLNYQDFSGKLYNTTAFTSFIDNNLETNTKYYYMFRAKNSQGFPSNPTIVYEVEIVENAGAFYHSVKPYDFTNKNLSDQSKTFNRFLSITPTFAQTLVNAANLGTATNTVSLGTVSPSVWNKAFKLRITSKDTGRKIDINFTTSYRPK